jgi:septum formation inhibitor MinC-like protein/tetratricopeptide repeat protein
MLPPAGGEGAFVPGGGAEAGPPEMFGTETMAELYARQGRLAEAIAVYRRLLAAGPPTDRRLRWLARMEVLDRARVGTTTGGVLEAELPRPGPAASAGQAPGSRGRPLLRSAVPHRMPLVIREPVRSGQVIYAEKNDLIVLAAVNSGAELVADGNIHVYATLRGRAFAGAEGCSEARVFCQRLEAELVAINDAYLLHEDIPPERLGRPGQVLLENGRCIILPF